MLVALADTHTDGDLQLTDHLAEVLTDADIVVHAGDFTTDATLEAFEAQTDRLLAVAGNSDTAPVRERLPETAAFEWANTQFVVAHGHRHDRTALSLLARQETAAIAFVGHTHSAGIETVGGTHLVNPGSHADPRGSEPTYATCQGHGSGVRIQVWTTGGHLLNAVRVNTDER